MRPKVALMTIFQVPNYGSSLASDFATQAPLSKLGFPVHNNQLQISNEWHTTIMDSLNHHSSEIS